MTKDVFNYYFEFPSRHIQKRQRLTSKKTPFNSLFLVFNQTENILCSFLKEIILQLKTL